MKRRVYSFWFTDHSRQSKSSPFTFHRYKFNILSIFLLTLITLSGCGVKEPIVLREVRDVVADATSGPVLKAEAVLYNPNNVRGKLKQISIDIFIDGKKAGTVNQDFKMIIPARREFAVPLEVRLALEDLSFFDTLLGVIGRKKFEVRYAGSLKLSYYGLPVRVPVDYKSEVSIKF